MISLVPHIASSLICRCKSQRLRKPRPRHPHRNTHKVYQEIVTNHVQRTAETQATRTNPATKDAEKRPHGLFQSAVTQQHTRQTKSPSLTAHDYAVDAAQRTARRASACPTTSTGRREVGERQEPRIGSLPPLWLELAALLSKSMQELQIFPRSYVMHVISPVLTRSTRHAEMTLMPSRHLSCGMYARSAVCHNGTISTRRISLRKIRQTQHL